MTVRSPASIVILTLADRQQWEQLEATGIAPSQCWRYAQALVASGYDPKLALVQAGESRLVVPFVERPWQGHVDIATLPGLSGASISPCSAAPLDRWVEFAIDQRWVSGYLQLSSDSYPNVPYGTQTVRHGHMFLLDPATWDIRHTSSEIIRRKVSAALREGAKVVEDRGALCTALQRLYPQTLSRFGARPLLSPATLEHWVQDRRNLVLGVALEGDIEAVHLVHVHGVAAEFHLAGLSMRGRALSALLHTTIVERLRSMGITRFNLGGGGNPGDGLYRFKSWLGARPVPHQAIHHVYDSARYRALCAGVDVRADEPWFPAYRRPRADQSKG